MPTNPFVIEAKAKVTYINKLTNEFWQNWKYYEDCSDEEKEKINLASYPLNSILFDRDLPDMSEEGIENDYQGFTNMMRKRGIQCFYSYRSPHGYHIIAPFDGLEKLNDDLRREIRKYYVSLFTSDPAKISDRGVVSLPDRPHFKNGAVYPIKENFIGINGINESVMKQSEDTVIKNQLMIRKVNEEVDFKNYFEEDNFFKFVKTHVIPDNTNRDITIFPNLAVAAVKSGKDKKDIDDILRPIIQNNFTGKTYQEFEGWYKKAIRGDIKDYNTIQLNNWSKTFSQDKVDFYDMNPIKLLQENFQEVKEKIDIGQIQVPERFHFYWDNEFLELQTSEVDWLVDKWIAKGDINWIAGKSSSFKSTVLLSLAYAVANGKLAFNKYPTHKCKVLYLNEENNLKIIQGFVKRVKKGLGLSETESNDVVFGQMENLKLDSIDDLNHLIAFIKKNNIEWLICDSFRRFISFDENSANDMNRFMDNIKTLRKICNGLTITIIHHLKKEQTNYSSDMRDMLRGSSDIVNSADSIIGVRRKHGFDAIQIEHIKNRSGIEMENKLILMDCGDDGKSAYFYESDKEMDKDKMNTKPDECAEKIIKLMTDKKLSPFKRSDLIELEKDYSHDTITKALNILEISEEIVKAGSGKYTNYTIVHPN